MMTVSQLAMLTVVAVASLRSLPAMADYGLASILLYLIPAVVFLVPTALVAAELATGWKGGVYVWVREAFGNRIGFLAIWLQWIQNVVWYPIQIAFIAVSLSYVFGMGGLGNNGVYVAAVIIVLYWASTMVALRGGNLFAKVGRFRDLSARCFLRCCLSSSALSGWRSVSQCRPPCTHPRCFRRGRASRRLC